MLMVDQGDGKRMTDYPEDKHQEEPTQVTDNGRAAPEADAVKQYDETLKPLAPGDIVEGRVVHVGGDEVLVDVGYKTEGRIPASELGLRPGQTPQDVLRVDDNIAVQVLRVDEGEGTVVLSKRRADERQAWERLTAKFAAGEPVEGEVTARVKGGLLVDLGVRGFVPASHVDRTFVDNLEQYVGQRLRFRILELDRQKRNVVLSRKELLEEELARAKEQAFSQLQEGQVVTGVVRRLTDFGAFVDIGGGVEGLLHVSEMAWSRVRHPQDVLHEGQEIKVKILGIDRERERISLSLKETQPDPWSTVADRYSVGQVVEGEVTRIVDFGAFVKLEDGIEGLVHISQLADRRVENPSEVVQPGQRVKVKIVNLDPAARRIGLSIRAAQPKETKPQEETPVSYSDPGPEGVTIGDVVEGLGELLERTQRDAE
ncbi:MAG: 30S ribosomal protein S1 [Firmicutes bacterium ZCTH02-B6]|nr:MAG: 30S ribosomal protein S1 [Firmicutes bacterium ZCTH02-B6]